MNPKVLAVLIPSILAGHITAGLDKRKDPAWTGGRAILRPGYQIVAATTENQPATEKGPVDPDNPGGPQAFPEKKGTVTGYDASSRTITIEGKDWKERAKISAKDAVTKKELLKEGTKVRVELEKRERDIQVKSINPL